MRARWWLGGTLALTVLACAPPGGDGVDPQPAVSGAIITNRNLDVLFMVDDSSSMRLQQTNLLTNFPMFMDVLKALPGGLPNIHVAVISSDMGAGDGSIAGCNAAGGKQGIFQYTPRGTCTASPLTPGATYLSNVGGQANYTGDISAAFSCIAALGEAGCGFEHQFASILRALGADGRAAPAENQGFLRRDALLAIVMITNEDDCSARPDVALFDTNSNTTLSSQLGPPSNFRCNEFGHVCTGGRPVRRAPGGEVTATVTLQSCTSAECNGALTPVSEFVTRIKALKAAPASEILLAAIAGPPTPYVVGWKAPSTSDSGPWPIIAHSCTAADTSFADPGVRVAQAVSAFGANGLMSSICEANYGPALQQIATRIGTLLAAGGGTGGAPGSIVGCPPTGLGGAGGGSGGATGAGGTPDAGIGAGGATGGEGGGTTGAAGEGGSITGAGGTGMRPRSSGGGWCQVGGGGEAANLSGVAFLITAWLARGRRRGRPGRARRARG
jgi:hypothetical protein